MDSYVFGAVLIAAACHAGWNAVLKLRLDPFVTTALIAITGAIVALPLLPVFGLPAWACWPWVLASVALHIGYYIGLTEAYRTGDMGQVYPIARGSAPLMTAILSTTFLGERLGLSGWAGLLLLIGGVFLLSTHGGRDLVRIDKRAVSFAFFTAVMICGYTIVDGIGGRVAGDARAYSVMLFLLDGLAMLIFVVARRGFTVLPSMLPHAGMGFFGGLMSFISYTIAIWAMSVAPIALVAALRETSVLFGAAIAVFILKEPLRGTRIAAAGMIVCGLVLMRLQ